MEQAVSTVILAIDTATPAITAGIVKLDGVEVLAGGAVLGGVGCGGGAGRPAPPAAPADPAAVDGPPGHAALFDLPRLAAVSPTAAGLVRSVADWTAEPAPLVPLYLRRPDAKPSS